MTHIHAWLFLFMNIHRAKGNTSSSSELIDYHVGFPEREEFYNDEKTCEMISRWH